MFRNVAGIKIQSYICVCCLSLGLIWFSTKDSCLGTLDNSSKRVEIQVRKMVNFKTPIVPQPQNRDFGDASVMNSTLNASRKRLLPENDDESRVAKHGKFEELELAKARVELQLRNIDVNRLQQLVTALSHRECLS